MIDADKFISESLFKKITGNSIIKKEEKVEAQETFKVSKPERFIVFNSEYAPCSREQSLSRINRKSNRRVKIIKLIKKESIFKRILSFLKGVTK